MPPATKAQPILIGITAATAVVHLFSVGVGAVVGLALPTRPIAIVAGLAFLASAAWTVRGDHLDDDEAAKASRSTRSAVLWRRRARSSWPTRRQDHARHRHPGHNRGGGGAWLGQTLGMVAADALAIVVGQQVGRRLP